MRDPSGIVSFIVLLSGLTALALLTLRFLYRSVRREAGEQRRDHFAQCNRPGCSCVGVELGLIRINATTNEGRN